MRMTAEKRFPMVGKKFSNGWKKSFQWLENFSNGWKIRAGAVFLLAALAGAAAHAAEAEEEALTQELAGQRLAVGRAALEDGAWGLARRQFQSVLVESPDRRRQAEAALWLARTALAEGKATEATRLLGAHQPKAGASPALLAGYALETARAAAASGHPEEALEGLEEFERWFAGDATVPAALRLGMESAAAVGKWDEAEARGRTLEALPPPGNAGAPEAWMVLADRMDAAGERDRARAVLEHVASAWPAPSAWHGWATVRLAELELAKGADGGAGKKSGAAAWKKLLAGLDPESEAASAGGRVAARALAAEGDWPGALEAAEQALERARTPEERLECRVLQARLLGASGRMEEGVDMLRELAGRISDESRAAELQLKLTEWLERDGRTEEAEAECRAWLEAFDGAPGTAEALSRQGRLLAAAGRPEEAAEAYGRAVAAEKDPAAHRALRLEEARLQAACGRHAAAEEACAEIASEAEAGSAEWGEARMLGAESKLAQGKEREAEIDWLDLSRSEPETEWSRAATARLGRMYEARGALDTAMEQYGRLIEGGNDPARTAAALMDRGRLRYGTGAFQAALEDFMRIRREFPRSEVAPRALFMSGWCLYLLGKDAEALAACERFLKEFPESEFAPDVRFWLGEKAFNEGDYAVAERRFAGVAADYPASARADEALYWAGRAAASRSAFLEANEHFNALMAAHPGSPRMAETLLSQGDVLCELGQFALAIVAFDEVIGKFPQSPEAMMARGRKGDCQFALGAADPGRYEEAQMSYRTLADFAGVPPDLALQARYKIGRCLEKTGAAADALEQYLETAYLYLQDARSDPESDVWFTRAAFAAAALQERAEQWEAAVKTYRRVAESGVPAAAEALARIERIREKHWIRE
jgi:TolA-binding protein